MPTELYKTRQIWTIDKQEIDVIPVKIKYLKELMAIFSLIELSSSEEETMTILCECARIAMKQHHPEMSKNISSIEDNFDLDTIYKILRYSAGIKIGKDPEDEDYDITEVAQQEEQGSTWDSLDLVKLESEVFLLGIWKNFDDLERSLCIEELMQILSTIRELSYEEKKFSAALQGVDLDGENGSSGNEWENLKARVASGGSATDANDILALQGRNAEQAGFGIGMGLGYEDLRDPSVML